MQAQERISWLTGCAAAVAMLLAGAQSAAADPATSEGTDKHSVSSSRAASAEAYWTPERMRDAVPASERAREHAASHSAVAGGTPTEVAGHGPRTSAGETNAPVSYIGKVFFTINGTDYACSGNAVVSANESTVATAGHCLNEGPGSFASKWVFAPGYDDGATPYGTWAATELVAPSAWVNRGDISYDTGFAVVSTDSGATLTDTVGASGVAFNQARGLTYTAYGYAAERRYDGQDLESCSGTASPDPYQQTDSQGIPCDLTGGSSGGPWLIGDGATGLQNSVNSFGYQRVSKTMFGPYWGSVIQNAYQVAQN